MAGKVLGEGPSVTGVLISPDNLVTGDEWEETVVEAEENDDADEEETELTVPGR